MNESGTLLELIQENLDEFCVSRRADFNSISPDLVPVVDYTQSLLAGGKRFRALFCYWSWVGALATAPVRQSETERQASAAAMVGVTAALEMFHAAALVHDDLLDQSDTRRGAPAGGRGARADQAGGRRRRRDPRLQGRVHRAAQGLPRPSRWAASQAPRGCGSDQWHSGRHGRGGR